MKTSSRTLTVAGLMLSVSLMTSCGDAKVEFKDTTNAAANSPGGTVNPEDSSWNSYSVTSFASLPRCDATKSGALAYVRSDKKFYACDGTMWQVEDIMPKDGFAVVDKWIFHADSAAQAREITQESYVMLADIGDAEIVKYANGSAMYTFSGSVFMQTMRQDNTLGDFYSEMFSFSGVIPNTAKEYSKIYKFDYGLLRVRINLSGSVPSFVATVDVNDTFSNNVDTNIPLTKDSL